MSPFAASQAPVTGFLGPSGAGKTTTLRMLAGLSEPDGRVARRSLCPPGPSASRCTASTRCYDSSPSTSRPVEGGRRLVDALAEEVARAAMAHGILLHRIAPAEDTGLERLFLELTASDPNPSTPSTDVAHRELTGAIA